MILPNLSTILRMAADPACLRLLAEVNRCYRDDPNYNWRRIITASLGAIAGEKIIRVGNRYLVSSFIPPLPSRAFMSMLLATQEPTKRFSQQARLLRSAPISFYIAITNRCTYNCTHCSAKDRNVGQELSTEEWKRVIADIQDMGTAIIGFTGGEPLLREDLEEIISSVDDRSVTYVFTNGRILSAGRAKALVKAGLFGIGVSLDSTNPDDHDAIRGRKGAFESALAAMENAREAGLHVMSQTVLAKEMLRPERRSELLELFKLAQLHGAREVRLLEPICSGNLLSADNPEDIFYSSGDRADICRLQEEVNRLKNFPKITAFPHTESDERYGCGAGNQHSYLSPDGQLYPCDFVPLSFGSVRERPVNELWREMTDAMGKAKSQCFAMTLSKRLRGRSGELPLPKQDSEEICRSEQSSDYPGFFRALQ